MQKFKAINANIVNSSATYLTSWKITIISPFGFKEKRRI